MKAIVMEWLIPSNGKICEKYTPTTQINVYDDVEDYLNCKRPSECNILYYSDGKLNLYSMKEKKIVDSEVIGKLGIIVATNELSNRFILSKDKEKYGDNTYIFPMELVLNFSKFTKKFIKNKKGEVKR